MANRTDTHRPGAIVPADYQLEDYFGHWRVPGDFDCQDNPLYEYYGEEVIAWYDDHPELQAPTPWAGNSRKCDVCGANYVHGALFVHTPTSQLVTMGQDCAEKYGVAARLTDQQRGMRAGRTARRMLAKRRMREALRTTPGLNAALKADHPISQDMRHRLIQQGKLSTKQIALAFKLKLQYDERVARDAAEASLNWIDVPATDKRIKITATVLGFKTETGYMGDSVTKMIIRCEHEGGFFKLYGTAPNAMFDVANEEHHTPTASFRSRVSVSSSWHASSAARRTAASASSSARPSCSSWRTGSEGVQPLQRGNRCPPQGPHLGYF